LAEALLGVFAQRLVRKLDKTTSCDSTPQYKGRTVVCELLLPNNTYADGTMQENATHLIQQGITTAEEIDRVLGL
jgi:type II secretory ATPase GspE/PulE/Tfp pilus assembly ATPase PilB-like protein